LTAPRIAIAARLIFAALKRFNALKLSPGQREFIRHRQVLLPPLNLDVISQRQIAKIVGATKRRLAETRAAVARLGATRRQRESALIAVKAGRAQGAANPLVSRQNVPAPPHGVLLYEHPIGRLAQLRIWKYRQCRSLRFTQEVVV